MNITAQLPTNQPAERPIEEIETDLTHRYRNIEPDAVTADWSGEPLDASFATDVLLRNWDLEKRRRNTDLVAAA